jgi:hypothetical protein
VLNNNSTWDESVVSIDTLEHAHKVIADSIVDREAIIKKIDESSFVHYFYVDPAEGKLIADLHKFGEVLESQFVEDKIKFKVFLDSSMYDGLKKKYQL